MRIRIIVLLLMLAVPLNVHATNLGYAREDGGRPGVFLSFGAGARALGMGRTFVGIADDATATYWNSAGLVQIKQDEVTALYASLYEQTGYSFAAYAHPLSGDHGTLGVALVNLNSGGFQLRDEFNFSQGIATLNETAALFSYARTLWGEKKNGGLSAGIDLIVVNQNINSISDTGYGMDIGLFLKPWGSARQIRSLAPLSLGLNLQNVIAPTLELQQSADKYPFGATLGLGYRLFENRLLLALDINKSEDQQVKTRFGGEYTVINMFAIRAGINETELTFGLGYKWRNYALDYALAYHDAWSADIDDNLGISHRFSLTLRFGNSNQ